MEQCDENASNPVSHARARRHELLTAGPAKRCTPRRQGQTNLNPPPFACLPLSAIPPLSSGGFENKLISADTDNRRGWLRHLQWDALGAPESDETTAPTANRVRRSRGQQTIA